MKAFYIELGLELLEVHDELLVSRWEVSTGSMNTLLGLVPIQQQKKGWIFIS